MSLESSIDDELHHAKKIPFLHDLANAINMKIYEQPAASALRINSKSPLGLAKNIKGKKSYFK